MSNSRPLDWLELPDELLYNHIATKLFLPKDFIVFGAVCRSWHVAYVAGRFRRNESRKLPMLMVATERDLDLERCGLYSITEKRLCNLKLQVPHHLYCPGSCYGWLAIVTFEDKVSLLNPFIAVNNKIDLPPLTALGDIDTSHHRYDMLTKVVLSANPTVHSDYAVMTRYNVFDTLAFFKPGDKSWTAIDMRCGTHDIIYYRDEFYVINSYGQVNSYDLIHTPPRKSELKVLAPAHTISLDRYLVEVSGELWQVLRFTDVDPRLNFKKQFDVYKLDFVGLKWIKMDSLQGHIFFLGDNSSFSLLASNFPECKSDTIYLAEHFYQAHLDGGQMEDDPIYTEIFSVKDGTFEEQFPFNSIVSFPGPIWIEPSMV